MTSVTMQQFAQKITSLTYIYLVLSAPVINAARVKVQYDTYNAAAAHTVSLVVAEREGISS